MMSLDCILQYPHHPPPPNNKPPRRNEYALDSKYRETILPPCSGMHPLSLPPPFEGCDSLCDAVKDGAILATASFAAQKHKEIVAIDLLSVTLSNIS